MNEKMHEAVLWDSVDGDVVGCKLCNHRCRISEGNLGQCRVRKNVGGKLYTLSYDAVCAVHVDPIEKKPLFHFQPGRRSFSIATVGCNFRCDFCQNWQISQSPRLRNRVAGASYKPAELVATAAKRGCTSIAYTYTEPTVFMELAADCGRLARKQGLANVFVSNGFMTIEALEFARDFLDGINVDLKSFREEFYRDVCKASLEPVLDSLRYIANETDIWLEVTTLVVPGQNDSDEELGQIAGFIADELGPEVPWHISRFHPDHERMSGSATPSATLERAHEFGRQAGLRYVYVGNLPGSGRESTHCHECGQLLIERVGYQLGQYNLLNGACSGCGTAMAGFGLEPVQL